MEQRKKELKEQYKQLKPDMGILMVTSKANNKRLLVATQDLTSMVNRIKFQLNSGYFPQRDLQQDWKTYGKDNFAIEVLDTLEYSKDESKTDYSEDLAELRAIWEEKLTREGAELY